MCGTAAEVGPHKIIPHLDQFTPESGRQSEISGRIPPTHPDRGMMTHLQHYKAAEEVRQYR